MDAMDKDVLGCLVRDIQTGASIGWVRSIVFDAEGDRVMELLIDRSAKLRSESEGDRTERLLDRPLFDSSNRYMGEIVDLVVGVEGGRLQGLLVERTPGERHFLPAYLGLSWEVDHWTLLGSGAPPEKGEKLHTAMYPAETDTPTSPEEDWMVGQIAAGRLVDRRGQVIIEAGQAITAGTVEQASRAGVLHRLDAELPR